MSYEYNAICDECGFKRKAKDIKKRWDGLMVCGDTCWEPRHSLDFYRPRNDVHKLPWTRPDGSSEGEWTPDVGGTVFGTYTLSAAYSVDLNNVVTYRITIIPTTTTQSSLATFSLPTGSVGTDKGGIATYSNGVLLGAVTADTVINVPDFDLPSSPPVTLIVSGSYIKA